MRYNYSGYGVPPAMRDLRMTTMTILTKFVYQASLCALSGINKKARKPLSLQAFLMVRVTGVEPAAAPAAPGGRVAATDLKTLRVWRPPRFDLRPYKAEKATRKSGLPFLGPSDRSRTCGLLNPMFKAVSPQTVGAQSFAGFQERIVQPNATKKITLVNTNRHRVE